jgi:isopenicillin-N epimerase
MAPETASSNLKELFLLRPDIVFLNHGSYGACPRPVFELYQQRQRELESQPVQFIGYVLPDLLQEARARLAGFLHTEANNIAFVSNATYGINIVARALKLQPGDEILGTDHEYGAIDRTWRFLTGKNGATYVNYPMPLPFTTPEEFIERFWQAVTPRTRVISISHITSPTALTFPVKEICRRAREAGILTVIDGAHAPGQIRLDLDDIGADFYSGNCHKWLSAPKGAGFLFARPEAQALIEPLVVSWGYESVTPGPSRYIDWIEWQGTRDPAAWLAVPAAIEFQEKYNWDKVRQDCHVLLVETRQRVDELTGLQPICPNDTGWYHQMATIRLPECDLEALKKTLWEDYQIEVPLMNWKNNYMFRVSIQGYNTPADIDHLLFALKQTLPLN